MARQGRGVIQGYNPVRCVFVLQRINHVAGGGSVYVVQSNVFCVAAHELCLWWVSKKQSNVCFVLQCIHHLAGGGSVYVIQSKKLLHVAAHSSCGWWWAARSSAWTLRPPSTWAISWGAGCSAAMSHKHSGGGWSTSSV